MRFRIQLSKEEAKKVPSKFNKKAMRNGQGYFVYLNSLEDMKEFMSAISD